ncbi:class I SAM-dependent methyltransferase [Sphingomonas sp. CJ20]
MGSAAHWFGSQLSHPRDWGGWLVGQAMRIANRAPTRLALEALDAGPGHAALDLGCGPGEGVALLALQAAHVHGVDASDTMIAAARRANRGMIAQGRVTLAPGRFEAIPLPDCSVDRILAANVAYFWSDMAAVIGEIRRVLRPGGRLVLYLTAAETMRNWTFADARTHRHFDAGDLQAALTEASIAPSAITITRHRLFGGVIGLVCAVDF